MVRKKRGGTKKAISKRSKSVKTPVRLKERIDLAWKNLVLFLIISVLSLLFYNFSSTDLLKNFFGIVSIIFGFLAFAFLITLIVLFILKKSRK